jgi:amino acid transporter
VSEKKGLKKELGLITLICLGVGGIIGSGIFVLPAVMGAYAGPSLILGILLCGIIIMFLGIAYAELGAAFPLTGGPYSLPRTALGDFGGFVMGWGYFLYLFTGTAGIIQIFIVYLGYYFPGLAVGATLTPVGISFAVIALWIFTFINILGVKWGGVYAVITTIGKLVPLFIFVLVGFTFFKGENFVPFAPHGVVGITLSIALFFWAYTGFEGIVVPAEEVKNPAVTIPWSMILTILITIFVYVIIAIAFVGMIDWAGVNLTAHNWCGVSELTSPFAAIAKGLKLPWLAGLIALGAIIATGGAGGSWVLFQGRMPFAMAKDKLFWSPMAKINKKYGTPTASLLFTSILTTVVLIAIPHFPSVALIAAVVVILPYAAASLSLVILRETKKEVKRPFKLPYAKAITLVGFILSTFLIYWASWPWTLVGIALIFSGYPAFLFVKRKNLEIKRNLWIFVYLISILIVSMLGNPFEFDNFTAFKPLNILSMPYDHIALALIAIVIYFWAFRANTKVEKKVVKGE